MTVFDYALHGHDVPEAIVQAHRAAWARIATPGSWWTGLQRVEAARLAREARLQRNDPPWLREEIPASSEFLPERAADMVRRIAADVHSIDREWAQACIEDFGDAAYVELCAVTVCVTAIDAFAEALGVPLEDLPQALPGEPDRVRPDGTADVGAFVPLLDPFAGPNVGRALSLAPADNGAFFGLVGSMYALGDFQEMVWTGRPMSRPQVELVAARVSAINECFY